MPVHLDEALLYKTKDMIVYDHQKKIFKEKGSAQRECSDTPVS